jgi:hypothetical protein
MRESASSIRVSRNLRSGYLSAGMLYGSRFPTAPGGTSRRLQIPDPYVGQEFTGDLAAALPGTGKGAQFTRNAESRLRNPDA